MSRRSLDSETPIMAPSISSFKRDSKRYSTYSMSPSFVSTSTVTADAGMAEIKQLTQGLERLENKPLTEQRFVISEQKTAHLSKLALGAKLDRALGRRMTNQDAVLRVKRQTGLSEKSDGIKA